MSGKRKRGALFLFNDTVVCNVECSDGAKFALRSSIRGNLIEINRALIDAPSLLNERPGTDGFLAILAPKPNDISKILRNLQSLESYRQGGVSIMSHVQATRAAASASTSASTSASSSSSSSSSSSPSHDAAAVFDAGGVGSGGGGSGGDEGKGDGGSGGKRTKMELKAEEKAEEKAEDAKAEAGEGENDEAGGGENDAKRMKAE